MKGEPAGDFGLSDARGTYHEDIFRRDIFAHFRIQFEASDTVSERHRYRAFCFFLSDNIAIQFRDNFPGAQLIHGFFLLAHSSTSTVMLPLV